MTTLQKENLNSQHKKDLSEAEEVVKALKQFYKSEVIPQREAMDEDPEVCRTILKKMGALGFLIPSFPEEYGGFGASKQVRAMLASETTRANPSLSLSIGAHGLLCGHSILFFGNSEQKQKYLPRLATGETIGCWGVTEPEAGSDVGSMRSAATLKGDHYILKGNKTLITNAPIADVAVVFAKVGDSPQSITGFIIEKNQAGLTFGKAIKKYGMSGSPTGDIYMDDLEVHKSQILGKEGDGFQQIKKIFNYERMFLAAGTIGIMKHCLQTALKFASTRTTFGQPIIGYQAIQLKIAEIYSKMAIIESAANDLYMMSEDSPEFHMKASAMKVIASKWTVEACSETMQILGGMGYTKECDIERFLRDSKLYEIGGGTTDIQLLIMFKGLTKNLSMLS